MGDSMNERWQPGDIAMTVTNEAWQNLITDEIQPGPAPGAIHQVTRITVYDGKVMLLFARWPDDYFEASGFRKIAPLTPKEHREAIRELAEDQYGKVRR